MTRTISGITGAIVLVCAACTSSESPIPLPSLDVTVTKVNGADPPSEMTPLPANRGDKIEKWDFTVEAHKVSGGLDASFDGFVRLSVKPGAVLHVDGTGASGRNIRLNGGRASGTVSLTSIYGATRLWAEDLGYVPAAPGKTAKCSNGRDDDGDVLVDYPADPGCAYADDDSESGGSYAAGVSQPVWYELPRVVDAQGESAETPYPYEAVEIKTKDPQNLVVTRVSSDGFYVTDLTDQMIGYNHLFAFNFSTPSGMRVCDRVTYLAGTLNEFFGFTELNFPSYRLDFLYEGHEDQCEVPEPAIIAGTMIKDPVAMEKLESGLVRIQNFRIGKQFGPGLAKGGIFGPDATSCDLNQDGQVDFSNPDEGGCADACAKSTECSEWTEYSARGNYKVTDGLQVLQINTSTVAGFDAPGQKGNTLTAVTGTLRNFSGGSLNWTIETRCADDLVCMTPPCAPAIKTSKQACVRPHTLDDTEGSN